jgi:hypothetical protein
MSGFLCRDGRQRRHPARHPPGSPRLAGRHQAGPADPAAIGNTWVAYAEHLIWFAVAGLLACSRLPALMLSAGFVVVARRERHPRQVQQPAPVR